MFYIKISNVAKTTQKPLKHMKIIEKQFRKNMQQYT